MNQFMVLMMAMFIVPKLIQYIPDFDPLMVIVGLFVLMAGAQHLGFMMQEGGEQGQQGQHRPEGTTERERQANRRRAAEAAEQQQSQDSRASPQAEGKRLLEDAERALQQNNWSRVKELAKKLADADPESARAWELLATAQKWCGEREEAKATVKKARDIYEVDSEGLRSLAKELESSKPSSNMVAEFEKKAEGFFGQRQYDLAVECYNKALEAVGEAPSSNADKEQRLRLLRRSAECAQQLQDWGACRRAATELLEADPSDPRALLQRAAANEALEKFKAALEDARKLLSIDPKSAAANRIAHNCQQALRDL